MRTIKFRGKASHDGNWLYGDLITDVVGDRYIVKPDRESDRLFHKVRPETVGQFTGLHDKNGKEIYEGDIIKGCWNSILTIVYDEISTSYQAIVDNGFAREISYYGLDKLEIIGNIHETPNSCTDEKNSVHENCDSCTKVDPMKELENRLFELEKAYDRNLIDLEEYIRQRSILVNKKEIAKNKKGNDKKHYQQL